MLFAIKSLEDNKIALTMKLPANEPLLDMQAGQIVKGEGNAVKVLHCAYMRYSTWQWDTSNPGPPRSVQVETLRIRVVRPDSGCTPRRLRLSDAKV